MDRNKWYWLKLTNGKHMVVLSVKDEEEAIIIAKSHIIRHNLDMELEVESMEEIQGLTDPKLAGIDPIIANN